MNALQTYHQAHKERIARIEARAYRPSVVVVPEPEPLDPPRTEEIKPRGYWFEIVCDGVVGREPRVTEIQDVVCEYFQITKPLLLSARRDSAFVLPRHIGMYLARELTSQSFPEIGRRFRRDHTVPIFAAKKIAHLMPTNASVAYDVAHIAKSLGGQ